MKLVLNIAKNELKMLFCSPIAWFILIIFSFQCGFTFSSLFNEQVQAMDAGESVFALTMNIYTSNYNGFLSKVLGFLYLYFPILTMGIMSREFSNGSVKLLYAAPIRNTHIVLGKYVALIVYTLCVVGVVLAYIIFGIFTIENLGVAHVFSALLGIFLLAATYAAIGLFMSSLTSYQVVAAVATLAVLVLLNAVGTLWQNIAFVRDITYWLCLKGRATTFVAGLISSEGIIYFVIVSALFITFTILYLRGLRTKRTKKQAVLEYAIACAATFAIGFLSSRPVNNFYYDSTPNGANSLLQESKDIMKKVDRRVDVTIYANVLDAYFTFALPKNELRMRSLFEKYLMVKPRLKFKTVLYYHSTYNPQLEQTYPNMTDEERARAICYALGVNFKRVKTAEEIEKIEADQNVNLKNEEYHLVWCLKDKHGHTEFVRSFNDSQKLPDEREISTAFKRLSGTIMESAFLVGHGERASYSDRLSDYSGLMSSKWSRAAQCNLGFNIHDINLEQSESNVLDSMDLVYIADPRTNFSDRELEIIKRYIDNGGNMLLFAEPKRTAQMNLIANYVGMNFGEHRLVQKSDMYPADLIQGAPTEDLKGMNPSKISWMMRWNYRNVMPSTVPVEQIADKGFTIKTLVTTDNTGVWNEKQSEFFEDFSSVEYNPELGEVEKAYSVIVLLERTMPNGKVQKILLSGDADWLSDNDFHMRRAGINSDQTIVYEIAMRQLTNGEYCLKSNQERPSTQDRSLNINPEAMPIVNTILIVFFPLLFLVWFVTLLIKRNSR